MKSISKTISSYRRQYKLSQEKLAALIGVSSTAVSKWERAVSIPDIDTICRLADLFDISVDKLLGRNYPIEETRFEDQADADRYYIARQLIECCTIARHQGLMAVSEYLKHCDSNRNSYLLFCVGFLLDAMWKQQGTDDSIRLLKEYAKREKDPDSAAGICNIVALIWSGENEEVIIEEVKAFLGRKYAHLIDDKEKQERWKMTRSEAIEYYSQYDTGIEDTKIMTDFTDYSDYNIQRVLKCIDNEELLLAMMGASANIRKAFMRNLSDTMLRLLGEDLVSRTAEIQKIIDTQKRLLELGREFAEK